MTEKKTPLERAVYVMVFFAVMALTALLQAVPVMVGASVASGYWPEVPAVSYWEAFWLTWAWGVIWTTVGRNVNS